MSLGREEKRTDIGGIHAFAGQCCKARCVFPAVVEEGRRQSACLYLRKKKNGDTAPAGGDHFGFYSPPSVADGTYRLAAVRGGAGMTRRSAR